VCSTGFIAKGWLKGFIAARFIAKGWLEGFIAARFIAGEFSG
jgi:hypothetical protein